MSDRFVLGSRTCGRGFTLLLAMFVLLAPAYLFADPLGSYRLHSDDFAYLGGGRTLRKAVSNLYVPHNTHIVPAWRIVSWGVMAAAGRLTRLQPTMAGVSYGILAATMVLVGRLVRLETRSTLIGLVAMAAVGSTWLMKSPATWFSAGQTLWAGFGVLMTLWYLQGWRRSGGGWRLAAAVVSTWIAGGMWTIGHVAGPAGAAYLWADGRPRCRRAAAVPLLATLFTAASALLLGARQIDATVSFHGRTSREALDLTRGVTHTLQAIPETLVIGNLGVGAETTIGQGSVFCVALMMGWAATFRRGGPSPLEAAGVVIIVGAYLVEWSFRGYLPFSSLRGVVPWYDVIPHLGAVLFAAGIWGRLRPDRSAIAPLTYAGFLTVLILNLGLIVIHQPRVTAIFLQDVPKMSTEEAKIYLIPSLQRLRAVAFAEEIAAWQNRHLAKLEASESVAQRLGIGRDLIHQAFGKLHAPEMPEPYDAVELLDLPKEGTEHSPEVAQAALGRFFKVDPEPKLPIPSSYLRTEHSPGIKNLKASPSSAPQ